jgi:hypothetical protein
MSDSHLKGIGGAKLRCARSHSALSALSALHGRETRLKPSIFSIFILFVFGNFIYVVAFHKKTSRTSDNILDNFTAIHM